MSKQAVEADAPVELYAQRIARAFQDAWPATIDEYLPAGGDARQRAIVKLCQIDLELRWRAGRQGRAKDYLGRYPGAWEADPDAARDLIASEFELRRDHLRFDAFCLDYSDRPPGLREHLRRSFPQASGSPRYRDLLPYRRGGLGEVFIATDEQLGRKVALKRIQERRRHDPRCREQFLFEAELTGLLDHPGIIPVYSLERDEDGAMQYAMHFVGPERGETLRAVIDALHDPKRPGGNRLEWQELRELLGRFVFICRTISYAHSQGYLHRDVKPENILIGHYGETWLIDWGIARRIETPGSLSPATSSTVEPGPEAGPSARQWISMSTGTPFYRSPEQAEGRPDLGPSSDVYSLGATLAAILTGEDRPREAPPATTSDEFDARRAQLPRGTCPRSLAAVCAKAMATDPEARYPNADALADDIQAFLDGERVGAWREPASARARRVIRKHPTSAVSTFSATVLAVVLFGSLNSLAYQREAAEAANQAALAEARGDLINAFAEFSRDDVLETKYHEIDPQHVTNALSAIQTFRRNEQADDPKVREDRAFLALKIANETDKRGSHEDSKAAYRLARDIYRALGRDFPNNNAVRVNLAAIHLNLANVELSTGETEAAYASLLAGTSLLEPIVGDDRSDHEARFKLAKIRITLATLEKGRNNLAASLDAVQSGLELMEDLVEDEPEHPDYLRDQAKGFNTLGNVLSTADNFDEALEAYNRGLTIREQLVREDSSDLENQADLALSLYNIGYLKGRRLDAFAANEDDQARLACYEEAMASLRQSWEIRERIHRLKQGDPGIFAQLCQVQGEIGSLKLRTGRTDPETLAEASKMLQSAINGYQQLQSHQPTSTEFIEPFAACYQNQGNIHLLGNNRRLAFESFTKAKTIYQGLLRREPNNPKFRQMLGMQAFDVGNLLIAADGSKEQARQYLEDARNIQQPLVEEFPGDRLYRRQLLLTIDLLEGLHE